jgi:lipopolysaccharide transport system ATP-binding protein
MKPQIEVAELSKAYTIGHDLVGYRALRDEVATIFRHPFKSLRGHKRETEQLWALREVTFAVNQGDVVGVIGRNGSGKSTLLKILSRIVEPTSGSATLRGRVSSLLEVGTGFHPELTGRENIYLNGALLGMGRREIDRKFDEIVGFSEIERFLDTPVKFYSSGMYVRLAFSIAAHLDPDVLIVDEVLAVGDAAFQRKSIGKMSAVAKAGRTVLFVSHNAPSVLALCDRGIYLDQGRVRLLGTALEAVEAYRVDLGLDVEPDLETAERVGAGGVRIERVWMNEPDGPEVRTVHGGEPFVLGLRASVEPSLRSSPLIFGFGIDTENGERLASCVSSWSGAEISAETSEIEVRCIIDAPPLAVGRFFLSVSVSGREETYEIIPRSFAFEVLPGAEILDPKRGPEHGPVVFPYRFEWADVRSGAAARVG